MSIFANDEDASGRLGMRLFSAPEPKPGLVPSGDAAMGHPVPFYRRSAGDAHLKQMGVTDQEARRVCINTMSDRIERDDPHGAMQAAYKVVDVTGVYRLLAVLCTAEEHAS